MGDPQETYGDLTPTSPPLGRARRSVSALVALGLTSNYRVGAAAMGRCITRCVDEACGAGYNLVTVHQGHLRPLGVCMYTLGVKLIHPAAQPPRKMTAGSAGFDLYSARDMEIPPAHCETDGSAEVGRALVPTGIVIELPRGTVGRVASRSGLSVKSNIEAGAGWIDSDYRGELMVELKNLSAKPFKVKQGDRVAQLMILPVVEAEVKILSHIEDTSRGPSGFGSTGS